MCMILFLHLNEQFSFPLSFFLLSVSEQPLQDIEFDRLYNGVVYLNIFFSENYRLHSM